MRTLLTGSLRKHFFCLFYTFNYCRFALTKLDILDTFDEVKVAVAYKLDGEVLKSAPGNLCVTNSVFTSVYLARAADWERVEVEYRTFPGWKTKTSEIRAFDQLPDVCKSYIHFIEDFVGVPIKFVGVGQSREALIVRTVNDENRILKA